MLEHGFQTLTKEHLIFQSLNNRFIASKVLKAIIKLIIIKIKNEAPTEKTIYKMRVFGTFSQRVLFLESCLVFPKFSIQIEP